ncbi:FG-GAP-like repeat-containing protein [Psychroserpens sp. BH13MA-6]
MKTFYTTGLFVLICFSAIGQITFSNNATSLGISHTCGTPYLGSGVSFYDFDNDGWDDLSFASDDGQEIVFYKNNNGVFNLIDLNLPTLNRPTKQINWVDIDNDGDKDLFVTSNTQGNKLFENTGNLSFNDITASSGLHTQNIFTNGAAWGDYDNDGYLDVYLSNKDITTATTTPNYLFKNNGDGTFTNVSISAGIDPFKHQTFCSVFLDINNDGWLDIYSSTDKAYNLNQLYRNNGDGTFSDISAFSNTDLAFNAMTTTVGDYNNDGWIDIYVTNTGNSALLLNNGNETFTDMAVATGCEFGSTGWGAIFLDADNDTDLDLYVSGSLYLNPVLNSAAFYEQSNGSFSIPSSAGFYNDEFNSYCNAIGDINNDGFPDFVVTNSSDQNICIWSNETTSSNNWLKINLEGTLSNRDAIGSKIEISINGEKQFRFTHCGEGYMSQNSGSEFFGLGTHAQADYVKILWPSGAQDIFYNVNANQTLNITEGDSLLSVQELNAPSLSIYPNPVGDQLFISSRSHSDIKSMSISDLQGKHIFEVQNGSNIASLDVSQLESGMYLISIVTHQSSSAVFKFIKN